MSKKNKIYWFEGVTKKGVEALLNDENSKYRWLRPQRNRRALVILLAIGLLLTALGSYWPTIKEALNLNSEISFIVYSVSAIFVIISVIGSYTLLRIAVRSIADAPDELLDERQITIRNTSFRYAYFVLGYIVMGLLLLMLYGPNLELFQPEGNDGSFIVISALFCAAALPSMVMAWRERDI